MPDERSPGDHADDEVLAWFRRWQQAGGPVVEESVVAEPGRARARGAPPGAGGAVTSHRGIDIAWRRTSYSGLIRAADQQPGGVASEPEDTGLDDEVEPVPADLRARRRRRPAVPDGGPARRRHLRLAGARGARGRPTRTASDLAAELADQVARQLALVAGRRDPDVLAGAMLPLHDTPLGPLAPGLTSR